MANPVRIKATVVSIKSHGEGVYTVVFRAESRFPHFKPGQFLHLSIDDFDPTLGFWPESRVFSIASRPGKDELIIVYSVKGCYTKKIEKALAPEKSFWLKLPYGDFILDSHIKSGQNAILVAGGTGISPFIPYLEIACERKNVNNKIHLFYGIRKNKLLLFPELIRDCVEHIAKFGATVYVEEEPPEWLASGNLEVKHGRLSVEDIMNKAVLLTDPVLFLSGPPMMLDTFKREMLERGVVGERIKIDQWD
jgi:NAD(P)H-flavin reductase